MANSTQQRRFQSISRSVRSTRSINQLFGIKSTQQAPSPCVARSTNEITKAQEVRIRTLQELAFSLHQSGGNPLITAINEVIRANGSENFAGGNAYEAIERWLEGFVEMRGGELPPREGWMMRLR